ncbi:hypothetical protein SmJEL517_g01548 [Synchytrium microbalum]|uniref:NADH-ubiquinone oxidoreductase 9.5 kDa subunit n=1 Tax=Synchytrium microbalum TaxID=1806994 RepID=A0A507C5F9_9FUNG|nr:uncharacterized protein SmJEL517_g01548 [Synchytrium microbalum]TPX36227.1 hypothetical protein SmJEL517_g01548 [Synchytrium microbalum]
MVFLFLKTSLYKQPVFFASFVMALTAPVLLFVVYPMRREAGYKLPPDIPRSFPIPARQRESVTGYDD